MTLPSSGNTISMSQMRSEYTNLGPQGEVRLSSFYYGASTGSSYLARNSCTEAVKATANDVNKHPGLVPHFDGIPTISSPVGSNPIKISQFYSKSYYYAPQTSSVVNGQNQTFNPTVVEGDALKSNTINSAFIVLDVNGQVSSTSTGNAALTISNKNRSYTTVFLNIPSNQRIIGKGGKGGDANNGNGSKGGDAVVSNIHLFLNNAGRVFGGGGGGAASGCNSKTFKEAYCASDSTASIGGCGGGGGKGGGPGGAGAGAVCGGNFPTAGFDGSAGDSENTGGGGAGGSGSRYADSTVDGVAIYINATPGAAGGGWGTAGGNSGGTGGSPGRAVVYKSGMYYKVTSTGIIAGTNGDTF